jgi:hypothetical protein
MLAALTFLTPSGGLLALVAGLPVAALAIAASQRARVRTLLGLAPPPPGRVTALVALVAVPLLLAIAAAGPALRTDAGRHIRLRTEAYFVLDVSRSMAASASADSPTRFAQAQAAAIRLRGGVPEVKAGVASLTTQLLPHLFPTPDETAFATTIDQAVGIAKPPPQGTSVSQTSFSPLVAFANQGFFRRATRHRLVVLLTDGESAPFLAASIGEVLRPTVPPTPAQRALTEPPISLLIVRFGSARDRIYDAEGGVEAAYHPDVRAPAIVEGLAEAARGRAFDSRKLAAVETEIRKKLGTGRRSAHGTRTRTTTLAPYFALAALIPLGFIFWQRNFDKL